MLTFLVSQGRCRSRPVLLSYFHLPDNTAGQKIINATLASLLLPPPPPPPPPPALQLPNATRDHISYSHTKSYFAARLKKRKSVSVSSQLSSSDNRLRMSNCSTCFDLHYVVITTRTSKIHSGRQYATHRLAVIKSELSRTNRQNAKQSKIN